MIDINKPLERLNRNSNSNEECDKAIDFLHELLIKYAWLYNSSIMT